MNQPKRTTYGRLVGLFTLLLALCLTALPVRAEETSALPLTMRLPVNVTFDQDGLNADKHYTLSLVPEESENPMPDDASDGTWSREVAEDNGTSYPIEITYRQVGEWWYALTLTSKEDKTQIAQYWLHVMALQTDNGQELVTTLHDGQTTGKKVSAVAFADAHSVPDTPVTPDTSTTETTTTETTETSEIPTTETTTTETTSTPSAPTTPSETPSTQATTVTTEAATESTEETTESTGQDGLTPSGGAASGTSEDFTRARDGSVLPAHRDRLLGGGPDVVEEIDDGDDSDVAGANRGRSPLTGDDSHLLLWLLVCAGSLGVLLVLGRGLRKKN